MKTLLVTGATSFVGRNLLPALDEQYNLICIVRPTEPARSWLDFAPRAELVSADLSDPQFARRLPGRADGVLHMAVAPPSLAPEPSHAFQVNAASAIALLEWGKRAKIERFVFTSSGSVYAAQPAAITEDTQPRPADLLGVAKYAAEMAVELYRKEFPSVILRIWRPYGPGQGESFLIPRLAARIRTGQPIILNRDGGPCANTIYISDMVEVMARALTLDRSVNLNAAHREAPSIYELCRELEQVLECPGQYEWRDTEAPNLIADVSRMQELLGYLPAVSLREGLRMMFGAKG